MKRKTFENDTTTLMISEWVHSAEKNTLKNFKLPKICFAYNAEENEKQALEMFRYVFEEVLGWNPAEAINYMSKEFVTNMGLNTAFKAIIFPDSIPAASRYPYIIEKCYPGQTPKFNAKRLMVMKYNQYLSSILKQIPPKEFKCKNAPEVANLWLETYMNSHFDERLTDLEKAYKFFASADGEKYIAQAKLKNAINYIYGNALVYFHEAAGRPSEFLMAKAQFDKKYKL